MVSGDNASGEWLKGFLALKGDRSAKVNASNNQVTLTGALTERLRDRYTASANIAGMTINPDIEIVPASPINFTTQLEGAEMVAKGTVPDNFDLAKYGFGASSSLEPDAFTDGSATVNSAEFVEWQKSFFSDLNANRSYSVKGDTVTVSGNATPFMFSDWKSKLKAMKLHSVSKLDLYPSTFHYPNYKRSSKISDDAVNQLNAILNGNQIFFETGSSEVAETEITKVDTLVAAINQYGTGAQFVIGGHADSTGNMELNKKLSNKRAEAVVTSLEERGISKSLFTVSSFGSSKSSSNESNAHDRRVEIIIK